VIGEVGMGKSRLLTETQQLFFAHPLNRALTVPAHDAPAHWFATECVSYMETASYWPWRALLLQLVDVTAEADQAFISQQLQASLHRCFPTEEAQAHWPYLAHFLGVLLDYEQQSKLRQLEPEALRNRIFLAVATLLEARALAAPEPMVIALDDLQWIDAASQMLLEHLLTLVNRLPILFLLAYTPERDKPCWQVREKIARDYAHCASELQLTALSIETCEQMLAARPHITAWPSALREQILGRAEGNPFFLQELAQAIQEQCASQPTSTPQPSLPDTLQELLMARLDRLDPLCREVAQAAAVIGRVFPYPLLVELQAGHPAPKIDEALLRLQRSGLIEEVQRLPHRLYRFRHGLMREVYYTSLSARVARQCHCQIAVYLEQNRQPEDESDVDQVAQHAFWGQDWVRALRYQLAAGQRAQALFANANAIDHYLKALTAAEQLPAAEMVETRHTLHSALGDLLITTGQYEPAHFHLEQALALTEPRIALEAQVKVYRLFAHFHEVKSEYAEALAWVQQGLALVGRQLLAEAVQLQLLAGLVHLRQGQRDAAVNHAQTALALAQQLEDPVLLGKANNLMGGLLLRRGMPNALAYFQRALEFYQQAGHLQGQATTHNSIATSDFNAGRWSMAEEHYRQARALFDQLADRYHQAFADNNLGGIALNQGQLDQALRFYQEALQTFTTLGAAPYVLGTVHMNLGATLTRRNELEAARQALRASQQLFQQAQAREFLPEVWRRLGELALAAEDWREAERQGAEALRLARELRSHTEQGCALRVLGEAALAQKKGMEAVQCLAQSQTLLEAAGERYELARTQLVLARARLAVQQRAEAIAILELCEQTFEQLEARLDLQAARALRATLAQPDLSLLRSPND
jgi:tetratricopeptide (TPR) repeat protein